MEFHELIPYAQQVVDKVIAEEKPDGVAVAVHGGSGTKEYTQMENPTMALYSTLKGVDLVFGAHDHRPVAITADSIALVNSGSHCRYLGQGIVNVTVKDRKVVAKSSDASLITVNPANYDETMKQTFAPDFAYNNLNPWKKIIVTAAGPIVNIVFAIILMFILVLNTPTLGSTTVAEFGEGAVSNAKLQSMDEIIKVGNVSVHTGEEIYYEIMMQGYEAIDITVIRDGKRVILENVVFNTTQESGVVMGNVDFSIYALSVLENVTIFDYLEQAFYRSINMVKMVFDSLGGIISGRFGMEAVSGPVGIVETVEQVTKVSAAALVNLVVMISMNLGIFNLLPIPALDGGRIVFHLIDGIAGRKVIKKEIEDTITAVTMMLLLGLMLLISIKDVINLF